MSRKRAEFAGGIPEMLVLSRKLGEKILIGDRVVVTVVKIEHNQIRLGIEAPPTVPVMREEIAPIEGDGSLEAILEAIAS